MDNLTHTLVGAALARTRLGRLSPYALPTLVVGANLPDLDIAVRLWAGPQGYLQYHRGVTHSILGVLLQAVGLALLVHAFEQRRAGRLGLAAPRPGPALVLALVALGSHPALDYLNVYGWRPWLPFDATWIYGDAAFIVDPWLWLLLGAGALLGGAGTRAGDVTWSLTFLAAAGLVGGASSSGRVEAAPALAWGLLAALLLGARWLRRSQQHAGAIQRTAWCGVALYLSLLFALGPRAERQGLAFASALVPADEVVSATAHAPMPLDPRHWMVYVETDTAVHLLEVQLGSGLRSHTRLERLAGDPLVEAARNAECAAAWRSFVRFPHAARVESPRGVRIELMDARYQHATTLGAGAAAGSWCSAVVEVAHDGTALCP